MGGTTTGAPSTGTFALGDFVVTQDARIFVCTVAGTPGTWGVLGNLTNSITPVSLGSAAVGTATSSARADHVHPTTGLYTLSESVSTDAAVTGTKTIPDVTTATVFNYTLTGSTTFTMPTAGAGKSFTALIRQDATGTRTPTFTGVKWANGTAPTWSTAANKLDVVSFMCIDGTNWFGFLVGIDIR